MKKILFILLVLLSACATNDVSQSQNLEKRVSEYFDELRKIANKDLHKINELAKAIDYSRMSIYEHFGVEKMIIADFKTAVTGIEAGDVMKMVFFMQNTQIVRSKIFTFEDDGNGIDYNKVVISIENVRAWDSRDYTGKVSTFSPFFFQLNVCDMYQGVPQECNSLVYATEPEEKELAGCHDWYFRTVKRRPDKTTLTSDRYSFTTCNDCAKYAYLIGSYLYCDKDGIMSARNDIKK